MSSRLAFHPDGTRLATAGRDRAVWLWDLARGEEVARLQGHTKLRLVAGLQPRRHDAGVRLRRQHGSPVGHGAAEVRYQARREAEALRPEAERLVEQLWRQKNDPARGRGSAPGRPSAERAAAPGDPACRAATVAAAASRLGQTARPRLRRSTL